MGRAVRGSRTNASDGTRGGHRGARRPPLHAGVRAMKRWQRGAAIVMAMVVVAVTATLVAGAHWRQSIVLRQAENELAYAQAKWLIRGAIDWAGLILREDARISGVDHLGEPWAVPLADTHLNQGDGRDPVYLAGQMRDEQARFNLRNLADAKGVNPAELEVLRRLLELVGASAGAAEAIAQRVTAPDMEIGRASCRERV